MKKIFNIKFTVEQENNRHLCCIKGKNELLFTRRLLCVFLASIFAKLSNSGVSDEEIEDVISEALKAKRGGLSIDDKQLKKTIKKEQLN